MPLGGLWGRMVSDGYLFLRDWISNLQPHLRDRNDPERQNPVHHRRLARYRPRHRQARGRGRRQHRHRGQDGGAEPEAVGHDLDGGHRDRGRGRPGAAARDEATLVRAARGLNHGEVRRGHVNLLAITNQLG